MADNSELERPNSADDIPNVSKKRASQLMFANDTIYAKIAYSSLFQNTTLVVIVFNAVWIGVDVQANHPVYKKQRGSDKLPLEPVSTVIEHLFCFYFSVELIIRFLAFRRKLDLFKDSWFVFDSILVLFMVIETWILAIVGAIMDTGSDGILSKFSALRLLRLLRLTRMTRIIREVPELVTLLKGMISATKAVGWILVFLLICQYVFSIIFVAQLGDPYAPERSFETEYWDDPEEPNPTAQELFGTIGDSMMSLFTHGMLADNLAQAMQAIKDRGGDMDPDCLASMKACLDANRKNQRVCPRTDECNEAVRTGGSLFLFWLFIAFMIISAFCLLNMLIGVLCEVIDDSAAQENEKAQLTELRSNMSAAFATIDTSKDGIITPQEWCKMKDQKTVRNSMAVLGVEDEQMNHRLEQMQESLFGTTAVSQDEETDERNGLSFDKFMDKVMEIRPDTDASALDIEILRVRVEREEKAFNQRLEQMEQALKKLNDGGLPIKPANEKVETEAGKTENGKTQLTESWLKDVPTEVLFAVLGSRAPPSPTPPKLLTEAS